MRTLFPPGENFRHDRDFKRWVDNEKKRMLTALTDKMITNISDHVLTNEEKEALGKGLKFIPNSQKVGREVYEASVEKFKRKLRLKMFFKERKEQKRLVFYKKSSWTPPETENGNILEYFGKIDRDLEEMWNREIPKKRNNLKPEVWQALKNLQNNRDIVIKKTDKGGGFCIMNKITYEQKVNELLMDRTVYRELQTDQTNKIVRGITDMSKYMLKLHKINEQTADFLLPHEPCRPPLFYGLPKIHKPNIPLRPIVSACSGPTDNLSEYLTKFIQPLVESLPAYIKDSIHFLNMLQNIRLQSSEIIFVTADVTSLYTNIPHRDGIDAALHYLRLIPIQDRPTDCPSPGIIGNLIEEILSNSTFSFGDKHYHQLTGTSMGTRVAPCYANLFMGRLDEQITNQFPNHITFYRRFIDDIFFIFQGPIEVLDQICNYMNTIHPTIKFTFNHSATSINFLDILLYKNDQGNIHTTIYRKPTDTIGLLHYDSHHPTHTIPGTIYSQALRYCTIITELNNLKKELKYLTMTLVLRDYPLHIINNNIKKALYKTQHELINNRRAQENTERLTIITPYTPIGQQINSIILNNWNMIDPDLQLQDIFPHKPLSVHTNLKSIKDLLIHTKHQQ
ncbi:uncharacterized protein LOC136089953 [Hydra vulgaris]|uniref:Uncharacterized protein LOC136089953 n=1 Tax=Hydra vulgaris TaxID=6087 RepID=A0ABM4DCK9_HYDVU